MTMPGSYTQLDNDVWKELPNRTVHKSGNVYAGKEYHEGYEVKVFVRKLPQKKDDKMSKVRILTQNGVVELDEIADDDSVRSAEDAEVRAEEEARKLKEIEDSY